jgi:hypothetical protein
LTAAIDASDPRAAGFEVATRGGAAVIVAAVALALAWHIAERRHQRAPS